MVPNNDKSNRQDDWWAEQLVRHALLRMHCKEIMPDDQIERELAKLKDRKQAGNRLRHRAAGSRLSFSSAVIRWTMVGVAACLLLLVGIVVWMGGSNTEENLDIAYDIPRKNLRQPTLVTSKGKAIPLSGQGQNISTAYSNLSARNRLLKALGFSENEVVTEKCSIAVPPGKSYDIVLADGSKVWLYADSKLTYPLTFGGKERAVYLQGQAEFEVTHDSSHPFVIITDRLDACVLGTELNVSCYPGEPSHVALLHGVVAVKGKNDNKSITLEPGQGATLMDDGSFNVESENMDSYEQWKNGYLYFDGQPLGTIVKSLGRWYRVKFVFDTPALAQKRLRFFCMKNDSLSQALELLNHFGNFEAVQTDDGVHIRMVR